jgi:hypothetical protein
MRSSCSRQAVSAHSDRSARCKRACARPSSAHLDMKRIICLCDPAATVTTLATAGLCLHVHIACTYKGRASTSDAPGIVRTCDDILEGTTAQICGHGTCPLVIGACMVKWAEPAALVHMSMRWRTALVRKALGSDA